jgi:peptide/nickel transport system permease protein
MSTYVLRKLLAAIPVLAGVIAVVFILTTVVPGDPARIMMGQRGDVATIERIREEMGLNKPLWRQFVDFFKGALTLDLGRSYRNNMPVTRAIAEKIPITAKIALVSMAVAILVGVTVGIVSAVKHNTIFDYGSMLIALLGISAPTFWVGLLLVLVFCVKLGWVPGTGTGDGSWVYLVLPVLTLGLRPAAVIARLTRSSMLEVMTQDYITTARAKGLTNRAVVVGHGLKNAMIPVITIIGVQTAELLSGAIITERVFSIPGLGRLAVDSLVYRDFPIIRGQVLFTAIVFMLTNLLVDLSYPLFDPRIRHDK